MLKILNIGMWISFVCAALSLVCAGLFDRAMVAEDGTVLEEKETLADFSFMMVRFFIKLDLLLVVAQYYISTVNNPL